MTDASESHLLNAAQAQREGRYADATQDLLAAIAILRQQGDISQLAQALRQLAETERKLHDPVAARDRYEEAVSLYRELGDRLRLAHTIRHLGDVHYESGRADLALPCYEEALDLYRADASAPPLDLANAIRSMAVLQEEAGASERARLLWEEARALYSAVEVNDGVVESSARIARLAG